MNFRTIGTGPRLNYFVPTIRVITTEGKTGSAPYFLIMKLFLKILIRFNSRLLLPISLVFLALLSPNRASALECGDPETCVVLTRLIFIDSFSCDKSGYAHQYGGYKTGRLQSGHDNSCNEFVWDHGDFIQCQEGSTYFHRVSYFKFYWNGSWWQQLSGGPWDHYGPAGGELLPLVSGELVFYSDQPNINIHTTYPNGCGDLDDQCPDDPNKTEPGICGCDVPDTDSDGDGTIECNDNDNLGPPPCD